MFAESCMRVIAILGMGVIAAFAQKPVAATAASGTVEVRAIKPPASGTVNVAFLISKDSNVMDIAGAWEVFQDVMVDRNGKPSHGDDMKMPFHLYTVSDTRDPVDANGLTIVPTYTFENAPKPQIIVIPAQGERTAAQKRWLEANSATADVTMSVCTGASVLAGYGFLDGQTATTHHLYQQEMQKRFPKVHFVSGTRYVENGKFATAGGLTSGVDLALHVVERYYGREVAENTADFLEYHSDLWKNPNFAEVKTVTASK
jgi:transcriptional regulator GlxA family with amidase domain